MIRDTLLCSLAGAALFAIAFTAPSAQAAPCDPCKEITSLKTTLSSLEERLKKSEVATAALENKLSAANSALKIAQDDIAKLKTMKLQMSWNSGKPEPRRERRHDAVRLSCAPGEIAIAIDFDTSSDFLSQNKRIYVRAMRFGKGAGQTDNVAGFETISDAFDPIDNGVRDAKVGCLKLAF